MNIPRLDFADPRFVKNPYAVLAEVMPSDSDDPKVVYFEDIEGWAVLGHAEVSALLRGRSYKRNPELAADGTYTRGAMQMMPSMVFMDDPDHRRIRGLVNQAFTKRATATAEPRVRAVTKRLLDNIASETGPVDLVSTFASLVPVIVIAEILGVTSEDQDDFERWADDLLLLFHPEPTPEDQQRLGASWQDLMTYLAETIETRRSNPGDDLISGLIAEQEADGSQLSDEEAVMTIRLLLIAGNVTTTDLIGNGLSALLRHPDQLALLQANPDLIDNAVEEILRYDSSVLMTDRLPTEDVEIDGCPIGQGQWIWPILLTANRDPEVHPDPDRFDIQRDHIRHVSFGAGPHFCLGAPLARMETEVAIGSIVARFPNLRLAKPDEAPTYANTPGFRGLESLEVLLH